MIRIGRMATVLAAVSAAGLLAACGSSSGGGSSTSASASDTSSPSQSSSSASPSSNVTIGVSFYTERIPLYATMHQGIQAAADAAGVKVIFLDANGSPETQSNQINSLVTQGAKAIIASPVDANALVPAYKAARSSGVKMVSAANKVPDSEEDAFVGPDLVSYATQTMDKLSAGIGGSGDIIEFTGPPVISFVQLQEKGWAASLAKNPGVKVVQTAVVDDLSQEKATTVATTALTAHPNVKGVMCSTDDICLGVIKAMGAVSIDPKSIWSAGWDGQQTGVDAIKAGNYKLTLSYLAYAWGQTAFKTALGLANGQAPASHYVLTPGLFIDSSNAATLTPEQISGQQPIG